MLRSLWRKLQTRARASVWRMFWEKIQGADQTTVQSARCNKRAGTSSKVKAGSLRMLSGWGESMVMSRAGGATAAIRLLSESLGGPSVRGMVVAGSLVDTCGPRVLDGWRALSRARIESSHRYLHLSDTRP